MVDSNAQNSCEQLRPGLQMCQICLLMQETQCANKQTNLGLESVENVLFIHMVFRVLYSDQNKKPLCGFLFQPLQGAAHGHLCPCRAHGHLCLWHSFPGPPPGGNKCQLATNKVVRIKLLLDAILFTEILAPPPPQKISLIRAPFFQLKMAKKN